MDTNTRHLSARGLLSPGRAGQTNLRHYRLDSELCAITITRPRGHHIAVLLGGNLDG